MTSLSDDSPTEEFVSLHPNTVYPTKGSAPAFDVPEPATVFEDVMIDIETMSLHPHNALILSIGMVEFNPRGEELLLGRQLLITPDVYPQLLLGRLVDRGTQKFWADQPSKAADHWLRAESRWPLKSAALSVKAFLSNAKRVWANGIQFDLSNIVSLCEQAGEQTPWHYRAPRDMRTFCEETPKSKGDIGDVLDFNERYDIVDHEPLSDCITQAYRIWSHWPLERST